MLPWGLGGSAKVHPDSLNFSDNDLAGLASIQGDVLKLPEEELADSMAEWEHSLIGRLRGPRFQVELILKATKSIDQWKLRCDSPPIGYSSSFKCSG